MAAELSSPGSVQQAQRADGPSFQHRQSSVAASPEDLAGLGPSPRSIDEGMSSTKSTDSFSFRSPAEVSTDGDISSEMWRSTRHGRFVGAVFMALVNVFLIVNYIQTSGPRLSVALPVLLLSIAVQTVLAVPSVRWARTGMPPLSAVRWCFWAETVGISVFIATLLAAKQVLVCYDHPEGCGIFGEGWIPAWFGALEGIFMAIMPVLYLLNPRKVVVAYFPGLLLGMLASGGMDTSRAHLVYPHYSVLFVGMCAVAAAQTRILGALHRGATQEAQLRLQNESLQKVLESRDRAQTRARDHKREREALITKQKAQQKLMGFVCHELRAPLHALKGIIASIDPAALSENVRGDLEFMDVSASQMSLIINDVLDLVTVQAGHQMSITPAWCDVRKAVRHARMFVDSYVQVPVRVRVRQDVPAKVWLDELRIKQVLLNGLSNASKLTTAGSILVRVRMEGTTHIRFDVIDSGPGLVGITEDQLFTPFVQGAKNSNANDAFTQGLGLGLPVCKDLVTTMQGEIHLQNRTDGVSGANFWFSVPCFPLDDAPSAADDRLQRSNSAAAREARNQRADSQSGLALGGAVKSASDLHDAPQSEVALPSPVAEHKFDFDDSDAGTSRPSRRGATRHSASSLRSMDASPDCDTDVVSVGMVDAAHVSSRLAQQAGNGAAGDVDTHQAPRITRAPSNYSQARTWSVGRPVMPSSTSRYGPAMSSGGSTPPMHKLKVLAIDDERVSRRILERFLRKLGHSATVLAAGEQALPTLRAASTSGAPFNVVLLDVMMAGQDGKQVCKQLRQAGVAVPIIATTGTTDVVALRDLISVSGFTTVLPKPFTVSDLGSCLHDTMAVMTESRSLEFGRRGSAGSGISRNGGIPAAAPASGARAVVVAVDTGPTTAAVNTGPTTAAVDTGPTTAAGAGARAGGPASSVAAADAVEPTSAPPTAPSDDGHA